MSGYIIEDIIPTENGFRLQYREEYCRIVHSQDYSKELLKCFDVKSQKLIKESISMYIQGGKFNA
ncbi:hypothetical protein [Cysteiniphilum litorale]|uniref:hypothetical protein n=1 Tax=Cysteiniphilum litorale TaxID=2056700 RepID=UPI003F882AB0